jgi:DNA mismatch repair ATPase MutS
MQTSWTSEVGGWCSTSLTIMGSRLTCNRHILQEKVVSNFIPNDTLLAGGEGESATDQQEISSVAPQYRTEDGSVVPSMILVTGPNFSGKSVYLKQVAIIVFMAHVGSFVPATRADIGLTDKIMTRVATRESVSRVSLDSGCQPERTLTWFRTKALS